MSTPTDGCRDRRVGCDLARYRDSINALYIPDLADAALVGILWPSAPGQEKQAGKVGLGSGSRLSESPGCSRLS